MRIGAHVSIAGSLDLAIDRAVKIGAECIQIHGSAPQRWQFLVFPEEQIKAFKQKAEEHKISPVFIHSIYLINLASENPYILERSADSLVQYLRFADRIGAEGVVFHVGSHKGSGWAAVRDQVFRAVAEILKLTSEGKRHLILENSAGAGGIIGAKSSELGEIVKAVKDPRLRVCLDTAHAFESGYNIATKKGLDETLEEFDSEIGLDRLVLIHANDSKTSLGSNIDRHENIGEGHIGIKGFRFITHDPRLSSIPFIIETPRPRRGSTRSAGFSDRESDKRNIETLKRLLS
jgi:deoxyribonuclease-4